MMKAKYESAGFTVSHELIRRNRQQNNRTTEQLNHVCTYVVGVRRTIAIDTCRESQTKEGVNKIFVRPWPITTRTSLILVHTIRNKDNEKAILSFQQQIEHLMKQKTLAQNRIQELEPKLQDAQLCGIPNTINF